MGGKSGKDWFDTLKERLERWAEALEDALAPQPQLVPVPVKRPKR